MPEPEEFIPPSADEPIPAPPPHGATDAGLGGELVDPADYTDDERLLMAAFAGEDRAMATPVGAPTWVQVLALAMRQLAHVVKGRVGENVNPLTIWYYGNRTVAAWCFIFVSWCLAMAGKTQAAGLALIGGKKAYVPFIARISGERNGHSGLKVGAVTAIASFSHIGFCTVVGSSTFNLLSGNSTDGSSSDAVTIKRYPLSIVSGYVNLDYAITPTPAATADDSWFLGVSA